MFLVSFGCTVHSSNERQWNNRSMEFIRQRLTLRFRGKKGKNGVTTREGDLMSHPIRTNDFGGQEDRDVGSFGCLPTNPILFFMFPFNNSMRWMLAWSYYDEIPMSSLLGFQGFTMFCACPKLENII